MPKQSDSASASTRGRAMTPPPLPDLTGIDLRTLRGMEHPGLAAAVERVLRHPGDRAEVWYSTGDEGGVAAPRSGRGRVGFGRIRRIEKRKLRS